MDNATVTVVPLEGGELVSKMLIPDFGDFIAKEVPIYEILLKNKIIKDYTIIVTSDDLPITITVKSKQT